jgi:hypothetical protein
MTLHSLKHSVWLALVASSAVVACSKSPATEVAYVQALGGNDPDPSAPAAMDCSLGSEQIFVQVGQLMMGQAGPTTIADGQHGLSIDCTVKPAGGGYDIELSAGYPSANELMIVTGHVDASTGGTVTTSYVNNTWGGFTDTNCTLDYSDVPSGMDHIAAGAIFAHIECHNLKNTSGIQVTLPSGMSVPEICYGRADFLFQNCADGS